MGNWVTPTERKVSKQADPTTEVSENKHLSQAMGM